MSFMDNGYSKRARNLLFGKSAAAGDPFFNNVVLLINWREDFGSNFIIDQSNWQGLGALPASEIFAGASVSGTGGPFGTASYNATQILPFSDPFSSTTRFKRPSGEAFTLELWFYLQTLGNALPSTFLYDMSFAGTTTRMVGFDNGPITGQLRFLNPTGLDLSFPPLSTWNFLQYTVQPGTDVYTIDLNGVQIAGPSGAGIEANAGSQTVRIGCTTNTNGIPSTWRLGPIRQTKGIARARGSVPTALFPTF